MSSAVIGALSLPLLLLLLALRVHVALALGTTGFLGVWLLKGNLVKAIAMFTTTPHSSTVNYTLAVVPLYILMGIWISRAGFAEAAYRFAHIWIGQVRGSLAIATFVANAFNERDLRCAILPW